MKLLQLIGGLDCDITYERWAMSRGKVLPIVRRLSSVEGYANHECEYCRHRGVGTLSTVHLMSTNNETSSTALEPKVRRQDVATTA